MRTGKAWSTHIRCFCKSRLGGPCLGVSDQPLLSAICRSPRMTIRSCLKTPPMQTVTPLPSMWPRGTWWLVRNPRKNEAGWQTQSPSTLKGEHSKQLCDHCEGPERTWSQKYSKVIIVNVIATAGKGSQGCYWSKGRLPASQDHQV